MDLVNISLLGFIQGASEFLPISSSGHLVIAQNFLGVKDPSILIETSLHLGTMLAILVVFRQDIFKIFASLFSQNSAGDTTTYRQFALMVLVGSIPAGLVGLLFDKQIERLFNSTLFVGFALLVTAGMLLYSKRLYGDRGVAEISFWDALFIGLGQAFAILPGISRSGSTIVAALFRKVEPGTAARFSLILSIPAVLGASIIAFKDFSVENVGIAQLALGTLISFLTGVAAIKLLLRALTSRRLDLFAFWCIAMGLLVILTEML